VKIDNNITISIKPRGNQRVQTPKEKMAHAQRAKKDQTDAKVMLSKQDTVKVAKNDPNDPTVSTKVLDSLDTGMINFSQEQRDVLSTIMAEKAQLAKVNIESRSN
jgi:hypothetical protein